MSTRQLSLKELRALAQNRLGNRAAELKTRQELIDALAATEPKAAPRLMVPLMVPLAGPLPEPVPPVAVKELPPEPMIWAGEAPLPQITARPLEALPPRIDSVPQVAASAEQPARLGVSLQSGPTPVILSGVEGKGRAVEARDARGRAKRGPPGTDHFFVEPSQPQLPVTYEDDRILTFSRDPKTLYVVWDFIVSRFEPGPAQGQVVNESGVPVQSFAVAGPSGSAFVEQLPPGVALKVEVRQHSELLGASGWVQLPAAEQPLAIPGPAPTGIEAPAAVLNAPSSVV